MYMVVCINDYQNPYLLLPMIVRMKTLNINFVTFDLRFIIFDIAWKNGLILNLFVKFEPWVIKYEDFECLCILWVVSHDDEGFIKKILLRYNRVDRMTDAVLGHFFFFIMIWIKLLCKLDDPLVVLVILLIRWLLQDDVRHLLVFDKSIWILFFHHDFSEGLLKLVWDYLRRFPWVAFLLVVSFTPTVLDEHLHWFVVVTLVEIILEELQVWVAVSVLLVDSLPVVDAIVVLDQRDVTYALLWILFEEDLLRQDFILLLLQMVLKDSKRLHIIHLWLLPKHSFDICRLVIVLLFLHSFPCLHQHLLLPLYKHKYRFDLIPCCIHLSQLNDSLSIFNVVHFLLLVFYLFFVFSTSIVVVNRHLILYTAYKFVLDNYFWNTFINSIETMERIFNYVTILVLVVQNVDSFSFEIRFSIFLTVMQIYVLTVLRTKLFVF